MLKISRLIDRVMFLKRVFTELFKNKVYVGLFTNISSSDCVEACDV